MKYKCTAIDIEGTDVKFPGEFRVGEVYDAVAAADPEYAEIYDKTEAFFAYSKVCSVDNTALFSSDGVTISFSMVEPDEVIFISREGNKVYARFYRNGVRVKDAEAACAPTDTFDFLTGASIAMNRLAGDHAAPNDLPKPLYNGKVVCLNAKGNEYEYTVGKIYQFKDGMLTTNCGNIYPNESRRCSSFESWQKWSTAEWLEIKED